VLLLISLIAIPAQAATEDEIEQSINDGIAFLIPHQNPDGSWGQFWAVGGKTGLAVLKLEDRAFELGFGSPFDPAYPFSGNVQMGLDYLFAQAEVIPIWPQPAGDPDTNGNGIGIRIWFDHPTYETGIAMMAIAASRDPGRIVNVPGSVVDGWTYGDVVQDAADYLAFGQNDAGWERGAWGYDENFVGWSDNSNSGYVALGLAYAETFGSTIPQFVKDELNIWIDYIQNDVNGDADDGGSGYTDPDGWVNMLKTGNLLVQMALVDGPIVTPRVTDAIDYIERHWGDPNPDPGWRDNYQAMYNLMKGLEAFNIQTLAGGAIDWFDELADAIIAGQLGDGSWPGDIWGDEILTTEWALLTLERVVPPFEVAVDIKPTSCRNPLNVKSKGVLPVAILGDDTFDVTQVDPASVRLEGIAPLRWEWEDVATPFEPYLSKQDAFDCTEAGPDGYLDLTLKFNSQEVIAALGAVNDGDVLVLQLTGNLMEEFGGNSIIGEDVVVILM
jgi:hypothetical protein